MAMQPSPRQLEPLPTPLILLLLMGKSPFQPMGKSPFQPMGSPKRLKRQFQKARRYLQAQALHP